MSERKDRLIERISAASEDADLLLDFMEMNDLNCLRDASEEQLEQYIVYKGL